MANSSTILLRLKTTQPEYKFFLSTVIIINKILFGGNQLPSLFTAEEKGNFNFSRWKTILKKFTGSDNQAEICALSVSDIMGLLGFADVICKSLVHNMDDAFRSMISARIRDWPNDWDSMYLKNAQIMFENFKIQFAQIPDLIELLNKITSWQFPSQGQ